jgi:O-antigen/teichoic acid export membrane protein
VRSSYLPSGARLRRTQRLLLRTLQNPLLRNGYLLTLSSALSALIGSGYWLLTAWKYDSASVGRNYAAISMMMFLAAVAQLDLSSAMVRFVPTGGRRTLRFVACAYLVSGSLAIVVSSCFVVLLPHVAPGLAFLRDPLLAATFVCATGAYTIFALQDSVLTGLRRTAWVPVENVLFACVKLVLVVILAVVMPAYGIFASWMLSLGAAVVVTSVLLFRWAIPVHQRRNAHRVALPALHQIVRFVAADYVGALFSIAAITMLPILVINVMGPQQAAYFSLAWVIAYSLHLININMGSSLVVETAVDQSQLAHSCRQVLSHTSKLLVPGIVALGLLGPYLLGVFGQPYREASGLLRLLAIASLPHLLVSTAISSARAQRRLAVVIGVLGSVCVLSLTLGWLLVHPLGIFGVGLAWLLAQSCTAVFLLFRRDLWLSISRAPTATWCWNPWSQRLWYLLVPISVRLASAFGIRRWLGKTKLRWRERRVGNKLGALLPSVLPSVPALPGRPDPTTWTIIRLIPTVTDVSVAVLAADNGPPVAVLKVAHTPEAARELRAQRDNLSLLNTNPRLGDWTELVPQVIEFRQEGNLSLAFETYISETNFATLLSRHADSLERLLACALGTIAQLHQRTGHIEFVDQSHLDRWVGEPLESLHQMCLDLGAGAVPCVLRLGETLRGLLIHRHVQVSWTHGDFTPGNVLLTANSDRVSGVVDWGGARPGQLCLLDSYLMLLTASSQTQGSELGTIVARLLNAGGLPECQRRLLEVACATSASGTWHDVLDERAMILLAWLHHVAEQRRKCIIYRRNRVWWVLNVAPVLRAFAAVEMELENSATAPEPSMAKPAPNHTERAR